MAGRVPVGFEERLVYVFIPITYQEDPAPAFYDFCDLLYMVPVTAPLSCRLWHLLPQGLSERPHQAQPRKQLCKMLIQYYDLVLPLDFTICSPRLSSVPPVIRFSWLFFLNFFFLTFWPLFAFLAGWVSCIQSRAEGLSCIQLSRGTKVYYVPPCNL